MYRASVIVSLFFLSSLYTMSMDALHAPWRDNHPELSENQLNKFNSDVVHRMETMREGPHSADWKGHGVSQDVAYKGEILLAKSGSAEGTYCTSATFQVFCESYLAATGRTGATEWFGATPLADFWRFYYLWALRADKLEKDSELKPLLRQGCAGALVWSGAAERIAVDELKKGDFIQFWFKYKTKVKDENGVEKEVIADGGHSAIVWKVDKAGDKTKCVWYWSSQKTNYDPTSGNPTGKPGYGIARRETGNDTTMGAIYEIHGARLRKK